MNLKNFIFLFEVVFIYLVDYFYFALISFCLYSKVKGVDFMRNLKHLFVFVCLMFILCGRASPIYAVNISMPEATNVLVKEENNASIDYSNSSKGYVMVKWSGPKETNIKILIKGPTAGKGVYESYQYTLRSKGEYEVFPLSDGDGKYNITVYKQANGSSYTVVTSLRFDVQLDNELAPYIIPNQYVDYTTSSEVVQKAAEICAYATDNLSKVSTVYDYVISNVSYDSQKASTVQLGYLPDVDETLHSKTGICFDYAALMSAMLRSQNVPTKLIVGYTGGVYHSWIDVWSETDGWITSAIYLDKDTWHLMDPTFASRGKNDERILSYIGDGRNYTAKYQY